MYDESCDDAQMRSLNNMHHTFVNKGLELLICKVGLLMQFWSMGASGELKQVPLDKTAVV